MAFDYSTGWFDATNLDAVDELGERDISLVTENVNGPEFFIGPVLEVEPEEVAVVWERAATKLDCDRGRKLRCSS